MQNFNDIKPIVLWMPINTINVILFIIFFVILYFMYRKLELSVKNKKPINDVVSVFWKNIEDFNNDLQNLEEKYLTENKDIFYSKLSEILKDILKYKTKKDISKLTLSEIKIQKINPKLIDLISNIYFKEYSKKIEDNEEIRKSLILEIKKLIK